MKTTVPLRPALIVSLLLVLAVVGSPSFLLSWAVLFHLNFTGVGLTDFDLVSRVFVNNLRELTERPIHVFLVLCLEAVRGVTYLVLVVLLNRSCTL